MKFKVGTHNLDNLFDQTRGMQSRGFASETSQVLKDVDRLNTLLENSSYAGAVGEEILAILNKYFLPNANTTRNGWFIINQNRKKLFSRKRDGTSLNLLPRGRAEWLGGAALPHEPITPGSIDNAARVIQAIKADVLCVVEVENNLALDRANRLILPEFNSTYAHNTGVEGNDERGIDIGILTNLEIHSTGSHADDTLGGNDDKNHIIFSRYCAEYEIRLPNGKVLWLLCNHFKSKQNGSQAVANAARVREILSRFDLMRDLVVVAGNFDDTTNSTPLPSLLTTPHLTDVLSSLLHTSSRTTYHQGSDPIDYLLVSQPLFDHLTSLGIEQRGLSQRDNASFPEASSDAAQAPGHAAVWAEFEIP